MYVLAGRGEEEETSSREKERWRRRRRRGEKEKRGDGEEEKYGHDNKYNMSAVQLWFRCYVCFNSSFFFCPFDKMC